MSDIDCIKYDLEHYEQFHTGFESLLNSIESKSRPFSEAVGAEAYTNGVFKANGIRLKDTEGTEGFLGKTGDVFFKKVGRTLETITDFLMETSPVINGINKGFDIALDASMNVPPLKLSTLTPLSDGDFLSAIRRPNDVINHEKGNVDKYFEQKDEHNYGKSLCLIKAAKYSKEHPKLAPKMEKVSNLSSWINEHLSQITIPDADMEPTKRLIDVLVVQHKVMVENFITELSKSKDFLEDKSYSIREVVKLKIDPDDILRKASKALSAGTRSKLSDTINFRKLTSDLKEDTKNLQAAAEKAERNNDTSKDVVEGIGAAAKLLNILTQSLIPVEKYNDKVFKSFGAIVVRNTELRMEIINLIANKI